MFIGEDVLVGREVLAVEAIVLLVGEILVVESNIVAVGFLVVVVVRAAVLVVELVVVIDEIRNVLTAVEVTFLVSLVAVVGVNLVVTGKALFDAEVVVVI